MNTSTDPWIPIVWADGQAGTVSLCEALERGEEIRNLAVRPHERIALMRLLICIVQAALDGPNDRDDWMACRPKIAAAALDYLKRWHKAFELLGDGPRFLQVECLKSPATKAGNEEGNSVSKLDLALATGNNSTVFDNGGGSDRTFMPAQLALMLLTYQCFSPGGRIGVTHWNQTPTPGGGASEHAPCIVGSMLHALVRGENLRNTVHYNMMNREQVNSFYGSNSWGVPVWERMPASPSDSAAVKNASLTYLGRLVPLSRSIHLADDSQSAIVANGLTYPEWREQTATIVVRQIKSQPTRLALRASVERAAWRELHSLAVIAVDQSSNGGPAALLNIADGVAFDLWVGGLAASKAKLVDTLESVFHVPAAMLGDSCQRVYEQGVRWAESAGFSLSRAVSAYHRESGDNLDRAEQKRRRQQIQNKATAQYWTDVEQAVPRLLGFAESVAELGQPAEWHKTDWGKAVWASARAAYDLACPHSTPRQMRAHAVGLITLHPKPAESAHTTNDEKETDA